MIGTTADENARQTSNSNAAMRQLHSRPEWAWTRAVETRCASCHGGDGNGGELGPAIVTRIPLRDDGELSALIREGRPGRGMPASQIEAAELADLIRYLRSMRPRRGVAMPVSRTIKMATGGRLEGFVLN